MMAYNIPILESLKNCCSGCANTELSVVLDVLLDDLSNGNVYSGELLSDADVASLNGSCEGLRQSNLGTLLNEVLSASQDYTTVEQITDKVKSLLSTMCETFRLADVSGKLSDAVDLVNGMSEWDEAEVKSYYLTGFEDYPATIDYDEYTMSIDLPYGSDVTAAIGNFELSDGASAYISDVLQETGVTENNLTSAKTYNVVSKNEEVDQDFVLAVTILENTEADLLTFSISNVSGTIDDTEKTLDVELPSGTSLTQIPTFTASENAKVYVGETEITSAVSEIDWTAVTELAVISEDEETTNVYTVSITVAAE